MPSPGEKGERQRGLRRVFALALQADDAYTMYIHLTGEIMGKHKSHGKDKKKGSQLVIRVDKSERDAFVALCDRLDTSAAREIRRFMREKVSAHSNDNPAPSTEPENAATADTGDDVSSVVDAAMSQDTVVADTPANDTRKPKKKRVTPKQE